MREYQLGRTIGECSPDFMEIVMNETLQQRLARQLAETNPGFVVRVGTAVAPAQGEREKLG